MEDMSLVHDSFEKQVCSNGTNIPNGVQPQYMNSSHNSKTELSNVIMKIDAEKYSENGNISVNDSPTNSLSRSCSSTVSSFSEVSPSGSLLGSDDQQTLLAKSNHWPLSTFFTKTVFSWKQKESRQSTLLGSPQKNVDKVGGSLALIQQSRPTSLPAKCALEEENHRKQHSAILETIRKREQREEKERRLRRNQQLKEEERLAEDSHVWYVEILPRFEAVKDTKKVHKLWWRGLPPSVRGKVWKLAICNHLSITPHLYNLCLDKALSSPINESLIAIKLDVSRTFPTLCVFQEGGPLFESLQGILAAYAIYRPDIGYVQGMSFIGAVLSLNMESADAFICFANLLNRPCHTAAFTLDQRRMNIYYKAYSSALAYKLPKVYAHFAMTDLSPDLYLLDWLYTIYAKAMPLDVTCRIWDIFLRDGEEFLFRTALGVLRLYQDELLEMDFVHAAQFLTKLPENLQVDALFDSIRQMSTTVGTMTFQQMLIQFS